MNEFEAKKRALVAESEVYRETLKLEFHNLRLYGLRTKQKLTQFSRPNPLFLLLAPLAGKLLKKGRFSLLRKLGMGILSWQLSKRAAPFLAGLFSGGRTSSMDETPTHPNRLKHRSIED